jgi:hypothetical protein
MRKPFDVFIEGLELANTRGNGTAMELFVAGVRGSKVAPQVVWSKTVDDLLNR